MQESPETLFAAINIHNIEAIEPASTADIEYTIFVDGKKGMAGITKPGLIAKYPGSSIDQDAYVKSHFLDAQVIIESAFMRTKLRNSPSKPLLSLIRAQPFPTKSLRIAGPAETLVNVSLFASL
jgi:hypothetical protein